ncbi:MAG: FAD-dependent oxidoreductase [Clostridia bacterium]|nr:FAD-dependent oxidoreductase [Clostridia bacterium]
MNYYTQPEKKIPIVKEYDVIVCGGGPAGFAAAVWAARQGADTLLIEQCNAVGGVATTGLMSHWTGETEGGFYYELLDASCDSDNKALIDPEKLKTVMLKMLEDAGVQLKLYTFCSDVIMDGDTIKGVVTQSKSGTEAFLAKQIIDCTGDGDIACKAGVPFYKGREGDGVMQPVTLMFKVANVDTSVAPTIHMFEQTCQVPKGDIQQLAREHISFPAGHVLIYPSTKPGIMTLNMTNVIDIDGTNSDDLTKAEIVCRNQMQEIIAFLREFVPGFENSYIVSSASYMGVRETRHFEGLYTLTRDDIYTARVFDDWAVTKAQFNFDIHNTEGCGLDANGLQKHFKQKGKYTIPFGCFVPKQIKNLMFAGRNISGTHVAHSSYRVMPICCNMGQSVGIAAALCVKKGITPKELDVKELQNELNKVGVSL